LNGLISVFENPAAELTTSSPVNGCLPLVVSFEDLSFTNNAIVSWQWDFGDGGGSSLQNPNYDYTTAGNFSVSLIVSDINGCQSLLTELDLIDVYNVPTANFIADIPFSCNSNELVSFTNNTLGSATYIWDFGDGNTSTQPNPIHNYATGLYSVILTATVGSCTDTLVLTNYIEVGAQLNSDFTSDVSSGCENLLVNFTDITSNTPDSWLWDFGDGTTSSLQNPSHNYLNGGVYDVTLTTSKGGQCLNSQTFLGAIEVYSKPDIQLTADTTYGCSVPFAVEFTDQTINAISWDWDFGNGITSTLANPFTLYNMYGSYDVSLKVTNNKGCIKTQDRKSVV
jgi:PKD repeat protein